jgi:Lsr2
MPITAKTVVTQVTDDLDGSTGAETVSFSYRGTSYEIDLGKRNASTFDKTMKPYTDAARKVTSARGGRRASSTGRRGSRSRSANELATIREWARAEGPEHLPVLFSRNRRASGTAARTPRPPGLCGFSSGTNDARATRSSDGFPPSSMISCVDTDPSARMNVHVPGHNESMLPSTR